MGATASLKYHPEGPILTNLYQGTACERLTSRTGTEVGHSDPRVLIDKTVWHLDVGSSHPEAVEGFKGSTVRRLKWYVSWVQNVVRQFGPYLS
eukprot:gene11555-12937_t